MTSALLAFALCLLASRPLGQMHVTKSVRLNAECASWICDICMLCAVGGEDVPNVDGQQESVRARLTRHLQVAARRRLTVVLRVIYSGRPGLPSCVCFLPVLHFAQPTVFVKGFVCPNSMARRTELRS